MVNQQSYAINANAPIGSNYTLYTTMSENDTTGPTATLGGKKAGCWKNPTPLAGPGKVILKATKGTGPAAAQVFVK